MGILEETTKAGKQTTWDESRNSLFCQKVRSVQKSTGVCQRTRCQLEGFVLPKWEQFDYQNKKLKKWIITY